MGPPPPADTFVALSLVSVPRVKSSACPISRGNWGWGRAAFFPLGPRTLGVAKQGWPIVGNPWADRVGHRELCRTLSRALDEQTSSQESSPACHPQPGLCRLTLFTAGDRSMRITGTVPSLVVGGPHVAITLPSLGTSPRLQVVGTCPPIVCSGCWGAGGRQRPSYRVGLELHAGPVPGSLEGPRGPFDSIPF